MDQTEFLRHFPCWDGKEGYKRPYLPRIIIIIIIFFLSSFGRGRSNTQNLLNLFSILWYRKLHLGSKDVCNPRVGRHIT